MSENVIPISEGVSAAQAVQPKETTFLNTPDPWYSVQVGNTTPVIVADDGTPQRRLKLIATVPPVKGNPGESLANAEVIENAPVLHRCLLAAFESAPHTKDCLERQQKAMPQVACFCWRKEADIVLGKLKAHRG